MSHIPAQGIRSPPAPSSRAGSRAGSHRRYSAGEPPLIPAPAAAPHVKPTRGVSVAFVVGLVTAIVVIVVAGVTFAITYTTSLATVEDVGLQYASSLVTTARVRTEDLFSSPTRAALGLRTAGTFEGMRLPSEEVGAGFDALSRLRDMMLSSVLQLGRRTPIYSINFDDGSQVATRFHNDSILIVHMSNGRPFRSRPDTCGCAITEIVDYHWPSMRPVGYAVSDRSSAAGDARLDGYDGAVALAFLQQPGAWAAPQYFDGSGTPFYFIPAALSFSNATDPLGVIVMSVSVTEASDFLRGLKLTENSHMFILDDISFAIAATTHPAPFVTLTPTTNRYATGEGANCANTAASSTATDTIFTIACRTRARDFPYPPLQAASQVRALMRPATAEVLYNGTLEADGEQYYAAAAKVSNDLRSFALSLLLLMPQKDVLGDIVRSRNIVIGIVVAVLLVAVATSSLVIALVMRPLRQVASKMRQTARLNNTVDDGETSRLSEVAALQNSYRRMDVAIKNFTKYVPRDVVKDLMKTNQLCLIEMQPKACTMLFVDIAGFTSMCERVPPEALSGLVSQYFEIMSSLVMGHSGLIDKFIGDCIMAVWGAPFDVPSKAARATLCGLRMDRETRVDPLLSAFDAEGEQLGIRVGVASGEVLAGNMGSAERMNYTVIGDAVNLASRIESLNKQFGTRVAVCDATARETGQLFVLRALANVAVVGKKDGVLVHEVVGVNAQPGEAELALLRADEEEVGRDHSSDAASQATFLSAASQLRDDDARRVPSTHSLLDASRKLAERPVVATVRQAAFARAFTAAVHSYIGGDFAAAQRQLAALPAPGPDGGSSNSGAFATRTHSSTNADGDEREMQPLSSPTTLGADGATPPVSGTYDAAGSPTSEALQAASSVSVELLRSLVQKAIADPPANMHEWDGIWHADSD